MPSCSASMSICDSMAKATCVVPGPRMQPAVGLFVNTTRPWSSTCGQR